MTGYIRQKQLEIQNGNVIDADDLSAEFDQLQDTFNTIVGHTHDGSSGEGAPITKVGPVQDLEVTETTVVPKTTNTLDLGTASHKFKNGRFQGTLTVDGGITGTLTGNASTATTLQTARTLTVGNTGKSFNGSANVSWSLSEIGVNNNTLTLATSGIATGSQTWTANQGSNATFTVNVPGTNLSVSGTGNTRTITSSTGNNITIPVATTSVAGWMSTGDKSKLDGIAAGAQVNVGTNLGVSGTGNTRTITSSTGSNITIPIATASLAGWMSTSDKSKLDGVEAGAQVNVGTNLGSSGTGATRTITSSTGSNTSITYSAADLSAVPTSRTLTAGDGLSGGGNLTANRSFAVDSTVIRTSGNQTLGGTKSFSSQIQATAGITSGVSGVPLSIAEGINVSGAATAGSFSGDGAALTSLNASNISSGTLNAARLPSTVVLTSRTISSGDGLSGGGNLSADRTLSVDSTVVRTSRSISTGDGLTGGGNLSANRTFAVDDTVVRTTGGQTIGGGKSFIGILFTGSAGGNSGDFLSTSSLKIRSTSAVRDGDVSAESYGNATSARNHIVFTNPNGDCGSISTLTNATSFNTTSDYRRKIVEGPITDPSKLVLSLNPLSYRWKEDYEGSPETGFLAHEVQEIVPNAVTGKKDEVNDNGDPIYQQMDHSKLVPLLTAALQDALKRIEVLESIITNTK